MRPRCCTDCNCITVVDDDSLAREGGRQAITELALKAGRTLYRSSAPPHEALPTLFAAAGLAKLLFSEGWLLESAKAAGEEIQRPGSKIEKPLKFFLGTLRVNAEKIGDVEPLETKEQSRTWFGKLLRPIEEAVKPWIPPPPPRPGSNGSPAVAGPAEPTAEERAELARQIREDFAAQQKRLKAK